MYVVGVIEATGRSFKVQFSREKDALVYKSRVEKRPKCVADVRHVANPKHRTLLAPRESVGVPVSGAWAT